MRYHYVVNTGTISDENSILLCTFQNIDWGNREDVDVNKWPYDFSGNSGIMAEIHGVDFGHNLSQIYPACNVEKCRMKKLKPNKTDANEFCCNGCGKVYKDITSKLFMH